MKILCVSAHYPPTRYDWGYTQLTEEVTDGLASRGHQLAVLTTTYPQTKRVSRPYQVSRLIEPSPDWYSSQSAMRQFWIGRRRREGMALEAFSQLVARFRPQVILFWNTTGLPSKLLKAAESFPDIPVVYYAAGDLPCLTNQYPRYWNKKATSRYRALVKRPLAWIANIILTMEGVPVQLAYENVACVSNHIRDMLIGQGVVGANIVVIHNGIAIKQFPMRTIADFDNRFLSCLYAGRIEAHKGVHTIVEAVHHLQEQSISDGIHVTLVGDGQPDYISMLKRRIQQLDLEQMITFQPRMTRSEMPRLLAQFDVLLIPSRFEALSRMVQEAMAIGLVVVGTATGGSSELLIDGETGLVFPPEDASALAAQLLRLVDEPDLYHRLAYAGRGAVVEHFTMTRMLDEIVVYLEEVVSRQGTP